MVIEHNIILLILACAFGIFMAWSVGANGLANIMSTTLGSKTATVKQAIIIAILFETAGAILGGSNVAQTVQYGIINTQVLNYPPEVFIYGMLAVILASASWMALASYFGFPVSITSAIVGASIGFGWLVLGVHAVHWKQVGYIAGIWVGSPFLAAFISYLLFLSVQNLILTSKTPAIKARRFIPLYLILISVVLSEITLIKFLHHIGYPLTLWQNLLLVVLGAGVIYTIVISIIRKVPFNSSADHHTQFLYVEKLFAVLMLLTTCAMVYAHGSNDIAIAVGPIAAIISLIRTGHTLHNGSLIYSVLTFGAVVVIIGLLTYGQKVIKTVGSGITALTPSRAYCATITAAIIVIVSTSSGIPVSATQTLVGAILGVGMARGIGALDLRVVRRIFTSWIITVPIVAGLAVLFFNLIRLIFSG